MGVPASLVQKKETLVVTCYKYYKYLAYHMFILISHIYGTVFVFIGKTYILESH